ncbi:CHASE2 domain-containing protein [Pleurocapsales cyanobacterium LEGE 10410]|nr:CHASE2 domain-containing protein [Pleurocapsales cyanobacterium LEGE 10410]
MKFQLEIQRIERTCLFKLTWGKGQQTSTILPYPDTLSQLYQTWRNAYLNFYKTALRARVRQPKNDRGEISLRKDWHRQLVQAEAQLLLEFHRWLRRAELYEIRAKIASEGSPERTKISLFLTCSGELERLPWETWELGAEFGREVAIARSPRHITNPNNTSRRSGKPRILAILGDDTGLDLKGDRDSLNFLQQVAEIVIVTWQPQQPAASIKRQIQTALSDPQGWSVLFFAGHSNETAITGGELAIAPKIALSIGEIAKQLKIALTNGLQFALFNSCSGLSIANSLIDLGLNQVAVMREPIHNQVAQVFLIQFLQALANHQNVQQALTSAEQHLKQEQNLTYPSAYLVPSLFCHPEAKLFRIEPWGWKQRVKKWLPTRTEAMIASTLCLLSIFPPLQNYLLDKRTLAQAIYRDVTGQIPTTKAPVTIVHIDEQSLTKAGIERPVPMNRRYLASLIDRLVAADAKIIGIDYLLDRPQPNNDSILARSVQDAVAQNQTWFIFGAVKQLDGTELGVTPQTGIASPNWTLQGYTTDSLPHLYLSLPSSENCDRACPFAYLLAATQAVAQDSAFPSPQIKSQANLRNSLYAYLKDRPQYEFFRQTKLSPLTKVVQYLGQQWLRPIEDFSLPPNLVYNRLPAWQLLSGDQADFSQQIIIIGSGGYSEAGLTQGSDNFATPSAVGYWQPERRLDLNGTPFTGSEFLAYMTHHFLERRLVIPIPELGMVLTALLIAKGIKLGLAKRTIKPRSILMLMLGTTIIYGLVGLQLYISGAILIPWLLPSVAIWAYILPSINKNHA